jgi:flavin reductase (DIM6/NTAB) family NADH-FMN oxidoreductase RutF
MKRSIGAKTIVYPTPVFVVGTYDEAGKPNVMTAAWGGICCSIPPCIAVSLRKATYTYGNIVDRKCFTINIPSEAYVREVDFFGMASGRKTHKFSACGLTAVRSEIIDAPYVKEFPLILECRLLHTVEIGLHTQFIGEIIEVRAEEDVLGANEEPDIEKIRPIVFAPGNQAYYGIGDKLGGAFSLGNKFRKS